MSNALAIEFDNTLREVMYDFDLSDEQKQVYVEEVMRNLDKGAEKYLWESEFFVSLPVFFAYEGVYGRSDDSQQTS